MVVNARPGTVHGRQVDYDHAANRHTLDSPRGVLPVIFADHTPGSLLDVGCGVGTWLKVARELGVDDVAGLDGVDIPAGDLLVPAAAFRVVDLNDAWSLSRRFDVALCLEVAEHLEEAAATPLVESLTRHADVVVFSAACPGQPGQHHVNCQWPVYWQERFNACGFVCSDAIRWRLWNEAAVDVWYRQNLFVAERDGERAGREERLKSVVHPDFLPHLVFAGATSQVVERVRSLEEGAMPVAWYATSALKALTAKIRRRLHPAGAGVRG